MKYFDNLPIFNNKFRNIFNKVRVQAVKDDQLVKYQMGDFETLATVSKKWYGNQDYWWVIALLNHIYDINHDVPFPDTQAEKISRDIAEITMFGESVLALGEAVMTTPQQAITFENENDDDYTVMTAVKRVAPTITRVGFERVSKNVFNIITKDLEFGVSISYVVLKKPEKITSTNLSFFSEVYDILLTETNHKRDILLLPVEYLNTFLSKFQLKLSERMRKKSQILFEQETYLTDVNLLRNYDDIEEIEYGVVVDLLQDNIFVGSDYFRQLDIEHYDFDQALIVNQHNPENVGEFAVSSKLTEPRVFNSGVHGLTFDTILFDLKRIQYSYEQRIIDAGEILLAETETIVDIDNKSNTIVTEPSDLAIFTTPIYQNLSEIDNISPVSYDIVSNEQIKVMRHGEGQFRINYVVVMMGEEVYFLISGFFPSGTTELTFENNTISKGVLHIGGYKINLENESEVLITHEGGNTKIELLNLELDFDTHYLILPVIDQTVVEPIEGTLTANESIIEQPSLGNFQNGILFIGGDVHHLTNISDGIIYLPQTYDIDLEYILFPVISTNIAQQFEVGQIDAGDSIINCSMSSFEMGVLYTDTSIKAIYGVENNQISVNPSNIDRNYLLMVLR